MKKHQGALLRPFLSSQQNEVMKNGKWQLGCGQPEFYTGNVERQAYRNQGIARHQPSGLQGGRGLERDRKHQQRTQGYRLRAAGAVLRYGHGKNVFKFYGCKV